MTGPLHASHFADSAVQATVEVVSNGPLARDVYRLRFECPAMARRIVPGQFLMMRLSGVQDPLLARPLALYDTAAGESGEPAAIDVVYRAKGKFTSRLAAYRPPQLVDVWGPLGNGFEPRPAERLIMVAGGIGQTPFLALGKEYLGRGRYGDPPRAAARASEVTLCYGARSADLLAGVEDFEQEGIRVRLATEDGGRGRRGLVTDLLREVLAEDETPRRIACCGPEPMMAAVARIAAETGAPCQVSLETPMACGIGICFTCVAKVRDAGGAWDYKRTCIEGPVFDADQIQWS